MLYTCAAEKNNTGKQGFIYVSKKINFLLFSSWGYSCGKHITSVTVWLVPLKQIGLVGDVPLRNNS